MNQPKIIFFKTDKNIFQKGDKIHLQWHVENADVVFIKPFGKQAPNGTKTFVIDTDDKFYKLELVALHKNHIRKIKREIKLERKKPAYNQNPSSNKSNLQAVGYNKDTSGYNKKDKQPQRTSKRNIQNKNTNENKLFQLFLSPKGRLGNLDYFVFTIATLILFPLLVGMVPDSLETFRAVFFLLMIYIFVILSIKRFHDLGKAGYYTFLYLIPYFFPVLYLILVFAKSIPHTNEYGKKPVVYSKFWE